MEYIVKESLKLGFNVTVYLIAGLPYQTKEELKDLISKIWSWGAIVGLSPLYVVPGTSFFEKINFNLSFTQMRSTALISLSDNISSLDILDLLYFCRAGNLKLKKD